MKRKYFAYPYIVWMILFIAIPMIFIFYYAFNVDGTWTFRKCWETLTDGQKWRVLLVSVEIAFGTTAICLLLGYPIAYILSNMKKTSQRRTVQAHLICSGRQQAVHIRKLVHTTSHGERNIQFGCHACHHLRERLAALVRSGDVEKHQFVGTLLAVGLT